MSKSLISRDSTSGHVQFTLCSSVIKNSFFPIFSISCLSYKVVRQSINEIALNQSKIKIAVKTRDWDKKTDSGKCKLTYLSLTIIDYAIIWLLKSR